MTDRDTAMESERLRRMAECWRASPAPVRAMAAARSRFLRASTATLTLTSLFASFAYGAGSAVVVIGGVQVAVQWAEQRAEPASSAAHQDTATRSIGISALSTHPKPVTQPGGERPVPEASKPPVLVLPHGDEASATLSGSREVGAPRLKPQADDTAAEISPGWSEAGATPASAAEASAWRRAASAFEKHDSLAADRALEELTAGADANTRDAAWLARAQLWISDGARDKAVPVLQRLATDGATAIIRKRAQDLLREDRARREPQR